MASRRSAPVAALAAALALGPAACDDGAAPEPDSELGAYRLVTVDDEPLPVVTSIVAADTTSILAARLDLLPDSVFRYALTLQRSRAGERDTLEAEASGLYGRDGSILWFDFELDVGAARDTAHYEEGIITVDDSQLTFRFERFETPGASESAE